MFFKRNKVEVVPASELTDYSKRFKEFEEMREVDRKQYASRKTVAIASTVTATTSIGLVTYSQLNSTAAPTIPVYETTNAVTNTNIEPTVISDVYTPLQVTATSVIPQQTGVIADTSLEMLAGVLDPVVQILVAISFPIASVIMVGACFFFMIGNTERAWSMIMNAGLGYVLIQLSPLFLEILRQVGEAV